MAKGPNLKQVAAAAKVSICTASKILSEHPDHTRYAEDTIDRVRATANKLGYRVDPRGRALRTKRSDCIALLGMQGGKLLTARAFQATTSALQQAGLYGMLVPGDGWGEQIANSIRMHRDGRCDGMLLLAWGLTAGRCKPLVTAGVPAVAMEPAQDLGLPSVAIDHLVGCRLAVEYLHQLGHRHLAWIGPGGRAHADGMRRLRMVKKAAKQCDCRIDTIPVRMGRQPADKADVAAALDAYLATKGRATALVCYHDELALTALQCCQRRGLQVPRDCSIIGHDDSLAEFGLPGLSSVGFGFDAAASKAVTLLEGWLEGEQATTELTLLEPTVIERDSCLALI